MAKSTPQLVGEVLIRVEVEEGSPVFELERANGGGSVGTFENGKLTGGVGASWWCRTCEQ